MVKIGFTGHRDKKCNSAQLDLILKEFPDAIWVTGGAVGFDNQVEDFHREVRWGEDPVILRPNYSEYGPKKAPLIRNEEIVNQSDLIYTCYDGRQKGGTFYTISYAKKLGKEVRYLEVEKDEL
jgi:hypothetical protein